MVNDLKKPHAYQTNHEQQKSRLLIAIHSSLSFIEIKSYEMAILPKS
jgi:hypothetical protein